MNEYIHPHRDARMPRLFKVDHHPLVKSAKSRQIYVGYMSTDPKSMESHLTFEKQLKCPEGDVPDWKASGVSHP